MDIRVSNKYGTVPVTVFHVNGPLNADEPLETMCKDAVFAGARNVLVDLTDTTYISSAGLRVLKTIHTMLMEKSKPAGEEKEERSEGSYFSPHLKLLNPSTMVKEVLSISGYDLFIESFENLDKAVNSFD